MRLGPYPNCLKEKIHRVNNINSLIYQIPLQIILGVGHWLFLASMIAATAYIFSNNSQLKLFLTLTAFSFFPWVFIGPITFLQVNSSGFIGIFCGLTTIIVWLWTILLFALATSTCYRLTLEKTLLLMAVPFFMTLVFISWTSGFITNIIHLLS